MVCIHATTPRDGGPDEGLALVDPNALPPLRCSAPEMERGMQVRDRNRRKGNGGRGNRDPAGGDHDVEISRKLSNGLAWTLEDT